MGINFRSCTRYLTFTFAVELYNIHKLLSINTLSYIVFRMAQSEPSSRVEGKALYNKNLSN